MGDIYVFISVYADARGGDGVFGDESRDRWDSVVF